VEECDKVVSFVDTVGHEPWLRTTIRGIVGQKLNYGLLTIAADQGPTHITKEHLGIILAMELPVIVAMTKIDVVTAEKVIRSSTENIRSAETCWKNSLHDKIH
jgi:elongation factor 1-alpha